MTIQRASCADPVEELIRSVYVHIPFCERRCGYCDFSIIANRSELIPRFLSALEKEILSDAADHTVPLKTLYLGGGTPTLLDESQLERLFHILNRFPQDPDCEVTIEANPEGLHLEKLLTLKNLGVNRISLGVQSFDDDQLKQLDRTHSARQAIEISQQIGELFENWSLDLIFGLPHQSRQQWQDHLRTAVSLHPTHLSTYALTIEKGTRFWKEQQRQELNRPDDQLEVFYYEDTIELLTAAGYEHYEISNFALPGMRSRHNQTYWTGEPFRAFGPGAAAYFQGVRRVNHRSPFTWMKRIEQGRNAVQYEDHLTAEERTRELLAVGLRMTEGIRWKEIENRTGIAPQKLCEREIEQLTSRKWLSIEEKGASLTPQGRLFADEIAVILI